MRERRMQWRGKSAMLGLLTVLIALPAFSAERLLFVKPDGWREVYAGREDALSTTEYVPEDQNENDWEEMLTVQILVDKPNADPDRLLSNVVRHLAKDCPSLEMQPIDLRGTSDDYPTVAVMLACGEHPDTGRGDFSILRGIAGEENFYLLQKSWRLAPYEVREEPPVSLQARKFWLSYLAYLSVCDPDGDNCPDQVKDVP